jgi:hypothetical protein
MMSVIGPSPQEIEPETGQEKTPDLAAGVLQIGLKRDVYRARRSEAPGREAFFDSAAMHEFVIINQ